MKTLSWHISIFLLIAINGSSQQIELDFDGQVSFFGSYTPDLNYPLQSAIRYIPEFSFTTAVDSTSYIDGEISLNMYTSNSINSSDMEWKNDLNPYRIWMRYAEQQWEVRLGLQKIDFGSAAALRPLQWFNQIDPRDPLQITNGVYGVLGRYYFLNNTNIWFWGLYKNKDRRGLDFLESENNIPEFGGRIQFPIPRGEMGFSYHHRKADISPVMISDASSSKENRFGFDAKWDIEIGFWLEASYTTLSESVSLVKNQLFATVGIDYTFGLGNGLNVILEHMMYNFSEKHFDFEDPGDYTASILNYPLGFDDQISSVLYYNWDSEQFSFFINYQHQFPQITGYLMAFYIPESQGNIQQTNWISTFSGPGLRIMLVYNH